MLILGVILLIIGLLTHIGFLFTIGIILAVIGLILLLLFQTGTYGNRRLF